MLRKLAVVRPKLSELKGYKNSKVLTYFLQKNSEISLEMGQELFDDLLRWMYLSAQRKMESKLTKLFGPLLILDELWHIFILHTRDYIDFCNHYFGEYFHHDVEPIGFEELLEENELEDYLKDCFKYLGSEWVERRFSLVFSS
ncbi:MAG: hypothetical protein H0U57_03085 [Tatlockia sp.]|nr:hypothetical protein [Tatlockia sp.]